jgi:DeoR/GlpR family transcriptional regulator of sugar metabolism
LHNTLYKFLDSFIDGSYYNRDERQEVTRLNRSERHEKLIELLNNQNVMSVSELSKELDHSMMTIHRDLTYLEQNGTVKRIHGGAALVKQDNEQPSFHQRIDEYSDEKGRIGKAAAKFIKNGSIVFFDAGTTPFSVIRHISQDIEFTAITNGLMTALAFCNRPKVNVIVIGGNLHQTSLSTTNYLAIEMIRRINADIAFISTKALSVTEGTYEAQLPLIEIKKAIVEVSKKIILLADHSKFESKSLSLAVPMTNIDMIITDTAVSEEDINLLKKFNIETIVV